jgi:site-specific recombinase XerD
MEMNIYMKILMRMFKRRNGFWYYTIERNRPHSLKTNLKSEATVLFNSIKREYLKGKIKELDKGQRITLSEFKHIFASRHTDIADDTIDAYDLAMRLFIATAGGSTLLSRAESQIDNFKTVCRARGVKKVSVNTYLRHIRTILNKAYEWKYIEQKPVVKLYKIGKRLPRILDKDEIELLLLHSQHCHFQMHRIIKFALWTGCRRAEIHGLRWQHIKGDSCRVIGKGDKERTIPLMAGALEALGPPKDLGPVFWQPHIDQYSKSFKALVRDCGIENVTFHKMRHTAATQMLLKGVSLESVQKILGHADVSTTQIYATVLQEKLKREMANFNY